MKLICPNKNCIPDCYPCFHSKPHNRQFNCKYSDDKCPGCISHNELRKNKLKKIENLNEIQNR